MKILYTGRLPEEQLARVSCRECCTLIEIQRGECNYVSSPRPYDDHYSVKCPCCDERIVLYPVQFK